MTDPTPAARLLYGGIARLVEAGVAPDAAARAAFAAAFQAAYRVAEPAEVRRQLRRALDELEAAGGTCGRKRATGPISGLGGHS